MPRRGGRPLVVSVFVWVFVSVFVSLFVLLCISICIRSTNQQVSIPMTRRGGRPLVVDAKWLQRKKRILQMKSEEIRFIIFIWKFDEKWRNLAFIVIGFCRWKVEKSNNPQSASHHHSHMNLNIKKSILISILILINRSSDEPSGGPGEDSLAGLRVHGLPNISSSRYI